MPLTAADLIPDEPLQPVSGQQISTAEDLLHHRVIARRVAELASESNGKVNIALFGPWGAGKSSFNALLFEELQTIDTSIKHVTYDAWKNAGEGFQANFLNNLATGIPVADHDIAEKLFEASTTVKMPFQKKRTKRAKLKWVVTWVLSTVLGIAVGLPLLWTLLGIYLTPEQGDFLNAFRLNFLGWSGVTASATFLVSILLIILEVTKINVQRSAPSHVSQFSALFDSVLQDGKYDKYVIFIDELDRCSPADVMKTLEGLRTFLGHPKCVFVVAFDREAIASTIAEHPGREIPKESSSPYYQTSGEYLDKIFQYQIALPPQPTHTFRHLATSLVKDRGGVWAELRKDSERRSERVVTLLSPMHLRSPRRTKVLLNDFAVNARIYESLGFAWKERAEEIAILTVIQTEFPRLAADLEREPGLMRIVMNGETPRRPELVQLLEKYRSGKPVLVGDGEPEGVVADTPLDSIVGKDNLAEAGSELWEHLGRYLRRVREMGAPEPKADLIMMHSDGDLMSFEDPGVYNILLAASDMPREDVLRGIEKASDADRSGAIDYLLRNAEFETEDQAAGIYTLVASIAAGSDSLRSIQASTMLSNIRARGERLDEIAMRGYGVALVAHFEDDALDYLLARARELKEPSVLEALTVMLNRGLDDVQWEEVRERLAEAVVGLVGAIPAAVAAYVERSGESDSRLAPHHIEAIQEALSTETPAEPEEDADEDSLSDEDGVQRKKSEATLEAELEKKFKASEVLVRRWNEFPPDSEIREDLLRVLRGIVDPWENHLDLHDRLVGIEASNGNSAHVNAWMLDAIADIPKQATARWMGFLSKDVLVEPDRKLRALTTQVDRAITSKAPADVSAATENALVIASLSSAPMDSAKLAERIFGFVNADWQEYNDFRLEIGLRLLHVVDSASGALSEDVRAVRVAFLVAAAVAAQADNATVVDLCAAIQELSSSDTERLIVDFSEYAPSERENNEVGVEVLLRAEIHARSVGANLPHLSASALDSVEDESDRLRLARLWLQTHPAVAELIAFDSIQFVPAPAWTEYSEKLTSGDRSELWNFFRESGPVDGYESTMKEIARAGLPRITYQAAAQRAIAAPNVEQRRTFISEFLTLPVTTHGAPSAKNIVAAMAETRHSTELRQAVRILKAYAQVFSDSQKKALRGPIGRWVEKDQRSLGTENANWLVATGFMHKKPKAKGAPRKRGKRT